ncbi:hypothetical protein TXYLGN1_02150 [Tepidimicrobium xylanilyticum]|nr:hypothetical protein EN5CB1_21380 [Tepidimicrobium xylanilyticum]
MIFAIIFVRLINPFNFLYRKYGKATEKLCELITYERVGRLAEKISY